MYDVRGKGVEGAPDMRAVTCGECEVEGHVDVEAEAREAPAKLHMGDRAFGPDAFLRSGMDDEEREGARGGEGGEVAASVGDAVHFEKAVGEKGDADRAIGQG